MKKKNLRTLAHLFILLLSSVLFPPPAGMPWARGRTGASSTQYSSDGHMLWNRTYGGPGWEVGYSLKETGDAGYIIAGTKTSLEPYNADIYLVRTNSDGNMLWNKTYGGLKTDTAASVWVTSDGGYIVAGYTESFGTNGDVYLVRTDSEGIMLWNRTYGGTECEEAHSIQETSDGGYIVAGSTSSFDIVSMDVYLVRTDSKGNMLWNRTYGRFENEQGYPVFDTGLSVQETSDGGYIIVGNTVPFGFGGDVCLIKTDSEGNMLWNRTYGGPGTDTGSSVQVTWDRGYIIAGSTKPFSAGDRDVYLVRTDSEGNMLWNRSYGGSAADAGYSVQETGDCGNIIVGMKIPIEGEKSDVYLLRTDSKGNMLWNKTYGGLEADVGHSVQETWDGGYIIAGSTTSPEMDVDIFLIKVAPFPVTSSITCQASANTTMQGDALNVSGTVTPSVPRRTITLTYTLPDGTTVTRTVKTDSDSTFLDEYAPNTPGSWEVTASMEGNEYYEASKSEPVAFTVEKTPLGVPIYLYGSLVAVVAIAILAAWLLLRRR